MLFKLTNSFFIFLCIQKTQHCCLCELCKDGEGPFLCPEATTHAQVGAAQPLNFKTCQTMESLWLCWNSSCFQNLHHTKLRSWSPPQRCSSSIPKFGPGTDTGKQESLSHGMPQSSFSPGSIQRQPAASRVSVLPIIKKGVSLHNHNPKGIFSSTGRQRRWCPPQMKLSEPAHARSACLPSMAAPTGLFLAPHFSGPPWRDRPAP